MPEYDFIRATAPYNFVPLPGKARAVEPPPTFDRYRDREGRVTGYFEVVLETLSPLYIRSTLTPEEFRKRQAEKDEKKKEQKPDFYSPGFTDAGEDRDEIGAYLRIPGSSLRGMIRNLVAIFSEGFFEGINDERFFYRAVADQRSSLGVEYNHKMVQGRPDGALQLKAQAGYFYRQGNKFFIRPAQNLPAANPASLQYFRVEEITALALHLPNLHGMSKNYPWRHLKVWFRPKNPGNRLHNNNGVLLHYAKLEGSDIKARTVPKPGTDWEEGWLVATGWMARKHMHWVIAPPVSANAGLDKAVQDADVYEYETHNGLTAAIKDQKFSVIPPEGKNGINHAVPCFYIERTDLGPGRINFGHTGYFRMAYKNTPLNNVPGNLKQGGTAKNNKFDLVEAIFGVAAGENKNVTGEAEKLTDFAGRVFFEDALIDFTKTQPQPLEMNRETARVLGTPKPTTFQHYLEQPNAITAYEASTQYNAENDRKAALDHWDSQEPKLRGFKLYWHRNLRRPKSWIEDPARLAAQAINNQEDTQHPIIRPVNKGARFRFRVRFENLSEVELGALALALDLPVGCAHKLGMGKPLGLGSVRLHCSLYITNRPERYRQLFDAQGNWQTATEKVDASRVESYKSNFAGWLLPKPNNSLNDLWRLDRMAELKTMLTYQELPLELDELTAYMEIPSPEFRVTNEYTERQILGKPREVKGGLTKFKNWKTTLKSDIENWARLSKAIPNEFRRLQRDFVSLFPQWERLRDQALKADLGRIMLAKLVEVGLDNADTINNWNIENRDRRNVKEYLRLLPKYVARIDTYPVQEEIEEEPANEPDTPLDEPDDPANDTPLDEDALRIFQKAFNRKQRGK
jgi:CRISPR-associated protein (TIGR03986 family)